MKKRILGLALAAAMSVSMLPTAVAAVATEPSGEGWKWVADANGQSWGVTLENIEAAGAAPDVPHDIGGQIGENISWVLDTTGTLTISGAGEWESVYPMPWSNYKPAIKSVVFKDGVTHIGADLSDQVGAIMADSAPIFNCHNLTSVTIPDSVTRISDYAFYRCPIANVNIHKGIEKIGENAFGGFSNFESINVDADNAHYSSIDGVLFNKDQTVLYKYPAGKLGDSYTVPDGVKSITSEAFLYCTNLKHLTISESVERFNTFSWSFYGIGVFEMGQLESVKFLTPNVTFPQFSLYGVPLKDGKEATLTIYGYSGSTAEDFVKSGHYTISMNDEYDDMVTFIPIEGGNSLYNFIDVTDKSIYYDDIKYVVDNGLFNGTSETTFSPDAPMTRAMFVTVLGRYANADTANYVTPSFSDSIAGQWYTSYVEWAAANNVVNGYGDGLFGVNDHVTVEQACVILARFADYKDAANKPERTATHAYNLVSDWAADSVDWAVSNGIYKGNNSFNVIPVKAPASRALVAKMMHAFSLAYAG